MNSPSITNKYLEKLAEVVKDPRDEQMYPYQGKHPHAAKAGLSAAAGAAGYMAGPHNLSIILDDAVHPALGSIAQHYAKRNDDVSEETINKFIRKHNLQGARIDSQYKGLEAKNVEVPSEFRAKDTPHALANSSLARKLFINSKKKTSVAHRVEGKEVLENTPLYHATRKGSAGYVYSPNKSGAVLLHELGHLVNHRDMAVGKVNIGTLRTASNNKYLKHAPTGLLLSDKTSDYAWMAQGLREAPTLVDELGTNARAAHHLAVHQPGSLGKSKAALLASAASYTVPAAFRTGGMYLGGRIARHLREISHPGLYGKPGRSLQQVGADLDKDRAAAKR